MSDQFPDNGGVARLQEDIRAAISEMSEIRIVLREFQKIVPRLEVAVEGLNRWQATEAEGLRRDRQIIEDISANIRRVEDRLSKETEERKELSTRIDTLKTLLWPIAAAALGAIGAQIGHWIANSRH